jgi:hypothetical protein
MFAAVHVMRLAAVPISALSAARRPVARSTRTNPRKTSGTDTSAFIAEQAATQPFVALVADLRERDPGDRVVGMGIEASEVDASRVNACDRRPISRCPAQGRAAASQCRQDRRSAIQLDESSSAGAATDPTRSPTSASARLRLASTGKSGSASAAIARTRPHLFIKPVRDVPVSVGDPATQKAGRCCRALCESPDWVDAVAFAS